MDISLKTRLSKITTFVFDVDGVMTDAKVTAFNNSDLGRNYNVRDGFGIQLLASLGYEMAIISGGKQESIRDRMSKLGVKNIYLSVKLTDKLNIFDQYVLERGLTEDEILFMGDDLPDYGIMAKRNVLSVCPADAVEEIQKIAKVKTTKIGGDGAVREIIEMVLKAQNKWNFHLEL